VCLGEDHGSKNDSDLRIALVEYPDFTRKVRVIMVESANVAHQDILDRFILEGEEMSREKLRIVWSDANGAEVWEADASARVRTHPAEFSCGGRE